MPHAPTIAPGTAGTRFVVKNPVAGEPLMDHDKCRAADGTYTVTVPIKRFAGPVDDETSTLLHAQTMIDNGLAERWCKLVVCAYVDKPGGCTLSAEDVLNVRFNGEDVAGFSHENPRGLTGAIGGWHETSFWVPLGKVKFSSEPGDINLPTPDDPGAVPEGFDPPPANNTIEVRTTVDNCYCFRIGWASLEVKVASPLALVHGNGQEPVYWRTKPEEPLWPGFITHDDDFKYAEGPLIELGIVPFGDVTLLQKSYPDLKATRNIDGLNSENLWEDDALTLESYLPAIAKGFGADYVNTLGHSMGGPSLRAMVTNMRSADTPRAISVISLGAPHEGSPLADLLVAYFRAYKGVDGYRPSSAVFWRFSDGYSPPGVTLSLIETLRSTPLLAPTASIHSLSVEHTERWNRDHGALLPTNVRFYAAASEADAWPADGQITSVDEYRGFVVVRPELALLGGFAGLATDVVNIMYQFVKRDPVFKMEHQVFGELGHNIALLHMNSAPLAEENDLFVTKPSALGSSSPPLFSGRLADWDFFGHAEHRDHAFISVMDPITERIIEQMVEADKAFGGLR